jgi:hypothetical protein
MPSFIQPTFAAGEIAPSLYARIDLAKYHAAAKLLRNFFVLPHGGAPNRAGTQFVGRCYNSQNPVVLIPFQFNLVQTYILEFGHQYMRVIMNTPGEGTGYVLEAPVMTGSGASATYGGIPIQSVTNANPGVITVNYSAANFPTSAAYGPFNNGDQVYISGTGTLLDSTPGKQYLVQNATSTSFTLTDLDGNVINTTSYGVFNYAAATVSRVFTLPTPYAGSDVAMLKWTQSADTLTLCHTSYPPMDLTRSQHWIWTLTPISFAPEVDPPTGVGLVTGAAGLWHYSYVVTAVTDSPPDESLPCIQPATGTGKILDSGMTGNTPVPNTISWNAVTAASYYRVYKANPVFNQSMPSAPMYGYIGTSYSSSFVDTEIGPDFTQAPPTGTNPFAAGPITNVDVLAGGTGYPSTIALVVTDPTGTGAVLIPTVVGGVITKVTIQTPGQAYTNPVVSVANQGSGAAARINVNTILSSPYPITVTMEAMGQDYYGPVTVTPASGGTGCKFTANVMNGMITGVTVTETGNPQGYKNGDSLVFTQPSGSGATFSAETNPSGNYPGCCAYFQQRKIFAGSLANPQTLWMTKPADYKNMDVTNPSQSSDAIVLTIAANQVNAIKQLVSMNNLIIMTSGGSWALIGGTISNPIAITPGNCIVVPQAGVGCADLPPIIANIDVLYVQSKGSIVRDLAYNFWTNLYSGTDMSILANHLFFGHNLVRWCYAEQPFYQIWCVRDDGVLLSFTYLKEQDVYAWAHHDSPGPLGTDMFLSVASIPEQQVPGINMDSVYVVVQRTIPGVNGGNPIKCVERMNGRNFLTNGVSDVTKAWFVDCGLQYNGNPVSAGGNGMGPQTVITGLDHLNGATVSILADGSVQNPQVVTGGSITLQQPATMVTVGLPYTGQIQTLGMVPDPAAPQVQSKRKKISAVTLRVTDTRGLKVGPAFTTLNEMKERTASVNMGAAVPLFQGDERVQISNQYSEHDDVYIQQDNPLPCTVLGIIPDVSVGDDIG